MSERRFYLDIGPGESRGVVTLNGLPERLLIERPDDPAALRVGARSVARVRRIERAFNAAFLAMPGGGEAMLQLREGGPRLTEGLAVEVEVRSEARDEKLATVRLIETSQGEPRLVEAAPDLIAEMARLSDEEPVVRGRQAREAADLATEAASAIVHALPSGGSIAVETTRALTAVDVDLGAASGEAKKAARRANLEALAMGARLLRLKGLGGLIVFDLVGKGHDAPALTTAARTAFAPDVGFAMAPLSRFGALEIALPRRRAPLDLGSARAQASEVLRMLEREAMSDPGARLEGLASPAIAQAVAPLLGPLNARFGGRLSIRGEAGRTGLDVRPS